MTRPPPGYRLASLGLALPLAVYTLARALRDGGNAYLRGRHGYAARAPGRPVWVHCASVGEVAAATPLLHTLADHGIGPLLVSTATPTGHARARQQTPAGTAVAYLPLDRPRPVRRFLDRTRPRVALILETELWPHLFAALDARGIPIVLVNARLSPRTLRAPAWWRRTAAWCLGRTTRILARSETDRGHFIGLGADPARLETVGNLKLASPSAGAGAPITLGPPFVLAASTHHDEELQLARAWRAAGAGDHVLAIAPRHPGRGVAIARALTREGFAVRRRSLGEPVAGSASIYLADTLGELGGLMAGAEVVFMGGSLIPRGGQNVLEPARAGRAIVTGPHMDNFADETAGLEAAGALVRAADAPAVVTAVVALLADPGRRAAMGERARAVLEAGADMAARYREALARALPRLRGQADSAAQGER